MSAIQVIKKEITSYEKRLSELDVKIEQGKMEKKELDKEIKIIVGEEIKSIKAEIKQIKEEQKEKLQSLKDKIERIKENGLSNKKEKYNAILEKQKELKSEKKDLEKSLNIYNDLLNKVEE